MNEVNETSFLIRTLKFKGVTQCSKLLFGLTNILKFHIKKCCNMVYVKAFRLLIPKYKIQWENIS